MRTIEDVELVALWGRVRGSTGPARLRALVGAATRDPDDDVDGWLLGAANVALVELHRSLAGRALDSTLACPGCGETVEFTLDADELLARARTATAVVPVEHDGWHVVWSPLTVGRFLALAAADGDPTPLDLLAAVVEHAKRPDGTTATPDRLPAEVVAAVGLAQSAADPLLEVVVALRCPACGAEVEAAVDLVEHVAHAVEASAVRVLDDVVALATTFGWNEQDVLAVPAWRRRAYLDRVGSDAVAATGAGPR